MPTPTSYTYSIADSFPNGKEASNRLEQEIQQSSIVTALDAINTNGDSCIVIFKDVLSAADKEALDGSSSQTPNPAEPCPVGSIIGDHSGEPLTPDPQHVIVDEASVLNTRIVELDPSSGWDPSMAHTRYNGFVMTMASGQPTSVWERTLDVDVQIVSGEHFAPADDPNWKCGDTMSFMVVPPNNGVIGALTASADEGDTVLNCSPTVLENAREQWHLCFTDLATFETRPYLVKTLDLENNKIVLEEELEEDLPAGSYVCLRIVYMKKWPVAKGVVQRFASDTPGASMIPSGYMFRATYEHDETPQVTHHRHFGIVEKYIPRGSGDLLP